MKAAALKLGAAARASCIHGRSSAPAIGIGTPSDSRCAGVTAATFQPPTAPRSLATAACSR